MLLPQARGTDQSIGIAASPEGTRIRRRFARFAATIRRLLPSTAEPGARRRLALIGTTATVIALLAVLWTATPLGRLADPARLAAFAAPYADRPVSIVVTAAGYLAAGLLGVPVNALIFATGLAFGPLLGLLYAVWGSMVSAIGMYWVGAALGGRFLRRVHFQPLAELAAPSAPMHGIVAVALLRAIPIAPYSAVNLLAGACRMPFPRYLLGTFLGMLPGTILMTLFSGELRDLVLRPTRTGWIVVTGLALIILAVTWTLRRFLLAPRPHRRGQPG